MALAPFEAIVVKKVGESGNDGTTDNDERTLPVYVGGQNFSIILVDSEGVQADVKVQVNNANSISPNLAHHAVHPASLGNESQLNVLINKLISSLVEICGTLTDKFPDLISLAILILQKKLLIIRY